jgi:hypothetical protein
MFLGKHMRDIFIAWNLAFSFWFLNWYPRMWAVQKIQPILYFDLCFMHFNSSYSIIYCNRKNHLKLSDQV